MVFMGVWMSGMEEVCGDEGMGLVVGWFLEWLGWRKLQRELDLTCWMLVVSVVQETWEC